MKIIINIVFMWIVGVRLSIVALRSKEIYERFPPPPKGARENFMTIFYVNRKPNWVKWWKTLIKKLLACFMPKWCNENSSCVHFASLKYFRLCSIWLKTPNERPFPPTSNMFLPIKHIKLRWRIRKISISYSWCCWCVVTTNREGRRKISWHGKLCMPFAIYGWKLRGRDLLTLSTNN